MTDLEPMTLEEARAIDDLFEILKTLDSTAVRLPLGYREFAHRAIALDRAMRSIKFIDAGATAALIHQLIESALDSDASGRPEGSLAQNALALRAALAVGTEIPQKHSDHQVESTGTPSGAANPRSAT